jgi:hypothetical protein
LRAPGPKAGMAFWAVLVALLLLILLLLPPAPPLVAEFVAAEEEICGRPANLLKGPLVKSRFCTRARDAEVKKKTCTAPDWKHMKVKDITGKTEPINFVIGV